MLFLRVVAILSLSTLMFSDLALPSSSFRVIKNACKSCFKRQESGHLVISPRTQMLNPISQLRRETQAASQILSESISRMEFRQQQDRIQVARLHGNERVKQSQSIHEQRSKGKSKRIVHVYQPDSRKDVSNSIIFGLQASFKDAANEGKGTSNPHSNQGQHQSIPGSSTSNPAVRPRVLPQTRFIRTSNNGESRYFGANAHEQRIIAMDRARSIARQTEGWRTNRETLSARYKHIKTRIAEKQAREAIVSPHQQQQQQLRIGTSSSHGQRSHNQAQGSQLRMSSHPLQSQSPRAIKPIVRQVKETGVVIDHPEAVQQHKLLHSPGSAFHQVRPNGAREKVTPSGQDRLSLRLSPPRASSPSHSTSSGHATSQDAHMSKFFGGWKTPDSSKRKRE